MILGFWLDNNKEVGAFLIWEKARHQRSEGHPEFEMLR